MVSEPGSFAEHTIVHRKPQIIADVIEHNGYPADVVARLHALGREIAAGEVQPLREDVPDAAFWRDAWLPWQGQTWRQLGWFFAETYFYRRLLETVGYFQPGPGHLVDPFGAQKREALSLGVRTLARFSIGLPEKMSLEEEFCCWLQRSLWGNRADLSNITISSDAEMLCAREESELLLIDHTQDVWRLLAHGHVRRLDLVSDNSGLELLSDLGLMDVFLSHGLVDRVHLHLKRQPFFVSDAMVKDLDATWESLRLGQDECLSALGRRLEERVAEGRLLVHDHPFWTTCLSFAEFPEGLCAALADSDLLVLKGDVNYRRLLQDRHWPPTTDLAAITAFMPTSFLALRTLKGELIVGLTEGKAEELACADPRWLINGERGLIHLVSHR